MHEAIPFLYADYLAEGAAVDADEAMFSSHVGGIPDESMVGEIHELALPLHADVSDESPARDVQKGIPSVHADDLLD